MQFQFERCCRLSSQDRAEQRCTGAHGMGKVSVEQPASQLRTARQLLQSLPLDCVSQHQDEIRLQVDDLAPQLFRRAAAIDWNNRIAPCGHDNGRQ